MNALRCLLAGLLLLAFGGGTALVSAQAGDDMTVAAIEMNANEAMSGGCEHCGGSDMAMSMVTCMAFGACVHGIISSGADVDVTTETPSRSFGTQHLSGFRGAPDPFPPKSHILV